MQGSLIRKAKGALTSGYFWFFLSLLSLLLVLPYLFPKFFGSVVFYNKTGQNVNAGELQNKITVPVIPPLDKVAYETKILELANNPPPQPPKSAKIITTGSPNTNNSIVDGKAMASNISIQNPPTADVSVKDPVAKLALWPVKTVYPKAGAILPFSRIVAYYGNLYSKQMGVLGEYPEAEMLQKLETEVQKWQIADPATPAIPALHYIAVVAQSSSGDSGKYRLRMPFSEIDKILAMAAKINAIVFLDVQVGFSNVQAEVPLLEKYLKMPQVHLALDPEFSMKGKYRPGKAVGTLDAADINFASDYLANLVRENKLTPKILIIHRYTQKMVTNYKEIKTLPEVQIIMNMDGWGIAAKKFDTYKQFIYQEPVQFTGFKLFYKNDTLSPGSVVLSPAELLQLRPRPIYIQYQ